MLNKLITVMAVLSLAICLVAVPALAKGKPMVRMKTNWGDILIELDADKAPKTVENFLNYVKSGHYDGTIFHRVVPGFVIQGGGLTEDMSTKPTNDPVENEADNGLKNLKYYLSMARTQDPHSATSQFFINLVDNDFLDHTGKNVQGWGYAVFGQVVEGQDVVDAIGGTKTGNKGFYQDVPVEPIIVEKAEVVVE